MRPTGEHLDLRFQVRHRERDGVWETIDTAWQRPRVRAVYGNRESAQRTARRLNQREQESAGGAA